MVLPKGSILLSIAISMNPYREVRYYQTAVVMDRSTRDLSGLPHRPAYSGGGDDDDVDVNCNDSCWGR